MTELRHALRDYLIIRRKLGYKLHEHERLLQQFITYLENRGQATITNESAVSWAIAPTATNRHRWSVRLSVVRGFAKYVQTMDTTCEIPPPDLLRPVRHRRTPYFYSEAEIRSLLIAAGTLTTEYRCATFRTLVGLLAVTGMRIGEAVGLDRADIDLDATRIVIRNGKFRKSREVLIHASTADALQRYLCRSDRPNARVDADAVFISRKRGRLTRGHAERVFRQLVDELASNRGRSGPSRGSMIFATVLPYAPSSRGTARTVMSKRAWRPWRHTWVTPTPPTHTGISPPFLSS